MRKHLAWLVVAVPLSVMILANLIAWPHLGDRVPLHWNLNGEVDSWGGKGTIWLLPCLFLWSSFLLSVITWRLPEPNQESNRKSILWLQSGIGVLFLYLLAAVLTLCIQSQFKLALAFLNMGFGVFMLSLGMSFKSCKRNPLIGIRTKWALASDENWDKTHRFAGSAFNLAGIVVGFYPYSRNLKFAGGIFLAALMATLIYSTIKSQLHRGSKDSSPS